MKKLILITIALVGFYVISAQTINLSGNWQVKLEANEELEQKYPNSFHSEGIINLPASLAEKGYGYKTKGSDFGILTPAFKYIGKAILYSP